MTNAIAAEDIERTHVGSKAREHVEMLLSRLQLPEELWDASPAIFSGAERQYVSPTQAITSKLKRESLNGHPDMSTNAEYRNLADRYAIWR